MVIKKDSKLNEEYRYGIALLKIIMCFEVVYAHFDMSSSNTIYLFPFQYAKALAVPCFTMFSFYFLSIKCDYSQRLNKMKNRINRLCLPHFVWTIIYYLGFIIFDLSNDIELGGVQY